MLDVRRIRTEFDAVRAGLVRRGEDPEPLERARVLDERQRVLAAERDDVRARVNAISKEVGGLRRDGKTDEAEVLQAESRALGERERVLDDETGDLSAELRDVLLRIPNTPSDDAPDGADETDNVVVDVVGYDAAAYGDHQRVPHWEIGAELGILDLERGAKVS